ncbi:zymogen granule membrane protein 16-like [Ambystoma mexicanum]|uniref:zymogen granule membrane protein 16-like n=1 Tax=Ambystoma mexicanum TaxID=8296 RepID=UPI0037E85B6D
MLLLFACLFLAESVFAANIQSRFSSFAGEYGAGGGTSFSYSGPHLNGPITALRIRENPSHILGIQIKYGDVWTEYYGNPAGTLLEVHLQPGEHITQASGKFAAYVNELTFLTNRGRLFRFGQPSGTSFNDFPLDQNGILRYVSGRYSSVIHSIGFHWDRNPFGGCVHCAQVEGKEPSN